MRKDLTVGLGACAWANWVSVNYLWLAVDRDDVYCYRVWYGFLSFDVTVFYIFNFCLLCSLH